MAGYEGSLLLRLAKQKPGSRPGRAIGSVPNEKSCGSETDSSRLPHPPIAAADRCVGRALVSRPRQQSRLRQRSLPICPSEAAASPGSGETAAAVQPRCPSRRRSLRGLAFGSVAAVSLAAVSVIARRRLVLLSLWPPLLKVLRRDATEVALATGRVADIVNLWLRAGPAWRRRMTTRRRSGSATQRADQPWTRSGVFQSRLVG